MNARMLGIICALLAAMPNLIGCESSRSHDYQFEKRVKRAQECRQLQDKLVGDQPLTPKRGEEIASTMAAADVLPDFRPLMPVLLRAFPLKDDSASAPQDQHNLI
jgi:hypothetical protein